MPRSRRTHHTGRGQGPTVGMVVDAKPVRQAVRVVLRRAEDSEADLPGSHPRQERLARLPRLLPANQASPISIN